MAQVPNTRLPAPSSGFSTIRFEKRNRIAWIALNRPRQLNAYNVAMRDDLFGALSAIHDDPEIRALVLTGTGPAFSTGGDVTEFGTAPSPTVARWVRFRRDVWGRMRALTIPTVAAVHGFAVGGGLEMVLLCDIAVASRDALFCLPETGLGMIPGVAGTQTAARRLRLGWALDLCLTGRWIDAREALLIGLVAEVVPKASILSAAGAMASNLSHLPRERVAMAKLAVYEGFDLPLSEALIMERRLAHRLQSLSTAGVLAVRRTSARKPGGKTG
jgi:enoyl-CoA hydratase/carnithine racemase